MWACHFTRRLCSDWVVVIAQQSPCAAPIPDPSALAHSPSLIRFNHSPSPLCHPSLPTVTHHRGITLVPIFNLLPPFFLFNLSFPYSLSFPHSYCPLPIKKHNTTNNTNTSLANPSLPYFRTSRFLPLTINTSPTRIVSNIPTSIQIRCTCHIRYNFIVSYRIPSSCEGREESSSRQSFRGNHIERGTTHFRIQKAHQTRHIQGFSSSHFGGL